MRVFLFLMLFPFASFATPFLTADPQCYDVTGANASCPMGYEVSEDGSVWAPLGDNQTGDQVVVWQDMAGYAPGDHMIEVRAYNSWGVSDPVPFDFTAGAPVGPTGLRLVAPPGSAGH